MQNKWQQLGDDILRGGALFYVATGIPFMFGFVGSKVGDPMLFSLWFIITLIFVLGMLAGILALEKAKEALSRETYTDVYKAMQR
jgi:hypothetical protein